jgi:geranylgeranyl diphosphate synthase type I
MPSLKAQLETYRLQIDTDITAYSAHVHDATAAQFGLYPGVVTDAFLDMLGRGGKRMRGALVMAGYQMCGGTDRTMIVRAATAIEMVHTHLLIIDDVQDRSALRRGKPTVHEMLKAYHLEHGWRGDATHTGYSLALNSAFAGLHAALMLIGGLNVEPQLRSNAAGIISHAILTTAHGQTQDFVQELTGEATKKSIEQTMEWKTAYYSLLNPLCVGMVLAGAGCEDTDAIRDYALHTGKAFQVTDDIIGVFGTDAQTGKSVMDDMREGKQTLLTVYAFEHAPKKDVALLKACLGNAELTTADFEKCRVIFRDCGALAFAEQEASNHIAAALKALETQVRPGWNPGNIAFLRDLAASLQQRAS